MPQEGIRRLSLSDLDETALRRLVDHGEDLFVEKKETDPQDGIGRTVAAFANSLGGWLLLGVRDKDGIAVGYTLPGRADPQSHIGQVLAKEVDPLPPYVAAARTLDGQPVVVIRVFESADTPHLLTRTGALVIRTPKGTETVTDQRLLLELARRGKDALAEARSRLSMDLIAVALAAPERPDLVAASDAEPVAIVRAALVTLTPQFTDWSISEAAARACVRAAGEVAALRGITDVADIDPTPRSRGVVASWRGGFQYPVAATVVIDSGGAIGARLSEGAQGADRLDLGSLRRRLIDPLVRTVALVLIEAEAYGRTTWRLDITLPRQDFQLVGVTRQVHAFFASAELSTPDDQNEIQSLSRRWGREYARACGEPEWA